MGHLLLKSKTKIDDLPVGARIEESDWSTLTEAGNFVQFEYIEDEEEDATPATPGIFSIKVTQFGLSLEKTAFTVDNVLKDFLSTKEATELFDKFFNAIPTYERYGQFPKRGGLFYGPAGTGKTTLIAEACRKYAADGKTFILLWHTDKVEAGDVKDFIKHLKYEGVEKMILVAEDIGGVEIDQARIRSESALLSLLDNQEQTFKVPVYIAATTNYPENFMGNLTNRPNRFDDKIRVGYPTPEARRQLLSFYDKDGLVDDEAITLIGTKKCEEFSPAHLREVIIRSAIHGKTPIVTIKEMLKEIAEFKKAFQKETARFGLVNEDE